MNRLLFRALGSTALAFCLLFTPLSLAFAQTINVYGNVPHFVIGNGDPNDNGRWGNFPDTATLGAPNNNTVNVHDGAVVVSDFPGGDPPVGVVGGAGVIWVGPGNVEAIGNRVTIAGTVDGWAYGGLALIAGGGSGNAAAANNTVTINGGTVNGKIYGGGALIWDDGGNSGNAIAANNTVTINGGIVNGNGAYGGEAMITGDGGDYGGNHGHAVVENNTLTINGTTINVNGWGYFMGGHAHADLGSATGTGNLMIINSGTFNGGVGTIANFFGGETETRTGVATAKGNSMIINSGTFNVPTINIYGGYAEIVNGTATATSNTVSISGGNFGGETKIYGGYAGLHPKFEDALFWDDGYHTNFSSSTATASGNTVTISGGNFGAPTNVYGGYIYAHEAFTTATATNNTVTISGAPTLNHVSLFGGGLAMYNAAPEPTSLDLFTGNTLNVWNDKGSNFAVANVQNFQYLNFSFPTTQTDPVLAVTGTAVLGDPDYGSSTVTASTIGGTAPLKPGAKVTLIDGTLDTTNFTQTQAQGMHGSILDYTWTLDDSAGLVATLDSVQADPKTKALSEARLGGVALVNQGADLVAGQGMAQAMKAAQGGFGSFAGLVGGASKYKTGSHVKTSGISLLAGLSWGAALAPGRLILGAFFEYGNGSYDTYNSFSGYGSANGKGDMHHVGGGILSRFDSNFGGYVEGSFRAGSIRNEYKNNHMSNLEGHTTGDYKSNSSYYGMHLGTGYIWKINEQASFDLYGKYFWTRQASDSVKLSSGDPVKFNAVDSHRLRGGARFSYAVNEFVSPYIGAAYEHELDGKAKASTYGYRIDAPKMSGGTGIGELGLSLKPSQTRPLFFDLGVQGYVGKREGVTGSLQMRWEF